MARFPTSIDTREPLLDDFLKDRDQPLCRLVAVTLPMADTRFGQELVDAIARKVPLAEEVIAHADAGGRVGFLEPLTQTWGHFTAASWMVNALRLLDPGTPCVGLRLEDKDGEPC